jgi:hypothetical protein
MVQNQSPHSFRSGLYSFPEVIFYFFIIFFPIEFYILSETSYFFDYQTIEQFKADMGQDTPITEKQASEFINKNIKFQKSDIAIFVVFSFSFAILALSISTVFFKSLIMKFYKSKSQIEKNIFFSAPSVFFFIYWAVCISGIITSVEVFADLIIHDIPQVSMSDVAEFREKFIGKRTRFTDRDVVNMINEVSFVQQYGHSIVQTHHIILCFFAVTGLALLIITTVSGQDILR